MPLAVAPIFFRRLDVSGAYLVSNQLANWAVLQGEAELHTLIAAPDSLTNADDFLSSGLVVEAKAEAQTYALAAEVYLTKKFQSALHRPSLVIVVPTLRCDHKCAYCQVSRAPLHSKRHDIKLDPSAVAKFIDSIAAKTFKLEFQGGEPLLEQDWIRELVQQLRVRRGESFEVVICSALGPPIDTDFLLWASEEDVQFSVSFDGFTDLHSAVRRHISIRDTASSAMGKAKELAAKGFKVSLVATLTKNALQRGGKAYVESCLASGVSRIYSRPLAEYGYAATTKSALGFEMADYLMFFRQLLDEQIERYSTAHEFVDDSILLWLEKIYRPNTTSHVDSMSPAGYAISACLINYDGGVFGSDEARMLYESTGREELRLGVLSASGFTVLDQSLHSELLANSFLEVQPHCETCAYQPFCGLDPIGKIRDHGASAGGTPFLSQCRITLGACDVIFERIHNGVLKAEMVRKWLSMY